MFASYKGIPKFRYWSRDPGHAHLGVILRFIRRKDPSSIFLHLRTIFEADRSIYSKVIWVPNSEIESRDPGHAQLGVVYGPRAVGVRSLCLYEI